MKIEFKELTLKNFLSFGNVETTFKFENGKIINIKGQNLDVDPGKQNGSSNGSGKTSAIQGLTYALYGNGVIGDIKQDEFINMTNGKDMRVVLTMNVDGKKAVIKRTRKPNSVTFEVDGVDLTRDSVANTSALIEEYVGVSYDTFVMTFLMTTSVHPLLKRKPSEQRNFMEDFLGMNKLSIRADGVKKLKSELVIDEKLLVRDLEHAEEMNEKEQLAYEQRVSEYDALVRYREQKVASLKEKVDESAELLECEEDIRAIFDEVESYSEELAIVSDEYQHLISESDKLNSDLKSTQSAIEKANSGRERIERTKDSQENIKKHTEEQLSTAKEKLKHYEGIAEDAYEVLRIASDLKGKESEVLTLKESAAKLNSEVKKLEEQLNHLKDSTCPYCRQQWTGEELYSEIEKLAERYEVSCTELKKTEEQLSEAERLVSSYEDSIRGIGLEEDPEEVIKNYEKLKNDVASFESSLIQVEDAMESLERDLESLAEDEKQVDVLKAKEASITGDLDVLEGKVKSCKKRLTDARAKAQEAKSLVSETGYNSLAAFERELANIANTVDEYERLKGEEIPFKDPRTAPPTLKDLGELERQLETVRDDIRHCGYLIKLLTDSKSFIRRNIIGKYVPYLNKMINKYSDMLDSPHICEIEDDLSVTIEYMRKPVSYHNLSAGEKLKLDISMSIALRDLMAMTGVRSEFLMVDEVFDSALDGQSKKNVFKLIKDRFDTVLLISHSGEFDDKCDDVWTVIKENGFTRLSA